MNNFNKKNMENKIYKYNYINKYMIIFIISLGILLSFSLKFFIALESDEEGVYEISSALDLLEFAKQVNDGECDLNAKLTQDIEFNSNLIDQDCLGKWHEYERLYVDWIRRGKNQNESEPTKPENTPSDKWTPIGTKDCSYEGTFDGNGKTISGLYFNDSEQDYAGLFGYLGEEGEVKNVGVKNSYFKACKYVGGVAGRCDGRISICYSADSTVTVTGTKSGSSVGGVAGRCDGRISICYSADSTVAVAGRTSGSYVGGVAGYCLENGSISTCYSTNIGLRGTYKGGICGRLSYEGYNSVINISSCYYLNDEDQGINTELFGVGMIDNDSLTDNEDTGTIAATVADFKGETVLNALNRSVAIFDKEIFKKNENLEEGSREYLLLTFEEINIEDLIIEIKTKEDLENFALAVNFGYNNLDAKLMNNIIFNSDSVMTAIKDNDGVDELGEAKTWTPIGTENYPFGNESYPYTGTFDGNGYSISGLYLNGSDQDYVGLFGYLGEEGKVKNVGVKNSYFGGDYYVGGVAGYCYGSISTCYVTDSTVTGTGYRARVGGLAGDCSENGSISNCYVVDSTVTGIEENSHVGGLAGACSENGSISNCYGTNIGLTGTYKGGICGILYGGSSKIYNCYYLKDEYQGINIGLFGVGAIKEKGKDTKLDSDEDTGTIPATVADFKGGTVLESLNTEGQVFKVNVTLKKNSRRYLLLNWEEVVDGDQTLGNSGGDQTFGNSGSDGFEMGPDGSGGSGDSNDINPIPEPQTANLIINHIYKRKKLDGTEELVAIDTDKEIVGVRDDVDISKFIDLNFGGVDYVYTGSSLDDDNNMILHVSETGGKNHNLTVDLNYVYDEKSDKLIDYKIKHEYYKELSLDELDGSYTEIIKVNEAKEIKLNEVLELANKVFKFKYRDDKNIDREYKYLDCVEENNTVVIRYVRKEFVSVTGAVIEEDEKEYDIDNSSGLSFDSENLENQEPEKDIDTISDDTIDTGISAISIVLIILIILVSTGVGVVVFKLHKKNKI